jgi:LacI family transcriptional regulator
MVGDKVATIREIAELAKVSIGTASFVLNGKGDEMRIAKETQSRILQAAKELGYTPSITARKLRFKKENELPVIAILWTLDTRSSLVSRFLLGIQNKNIYKDGMFDLIIQPYENNKLYKEEGLITGRKYNGAIIANASDEDMEYLENTNINVPLVIYQRKSQKYSTVHVDSKKTGEMVAEKFIANGHKRIGMVLPKISSQAIQLRVEGFIERLEKSKITLNPNYILHGDFSEDGGYEVMKIFLQQHQKIPTAFFFLSDQMAIGALAAFKEKGIRVPKDVKIIAHDNEPITRFTSPPLSTVHLPVEDMSEACVRILLGLIKNEIDSTPISQQYESYIIERGSS